ncbi:MAG: FtsX-like permease family protein [Acidobacteria bacterium]|nr:MAG: FtsX-like permease family protein [Acidobacteriota bacterium]
MLAYHIRIAWKSLKRNPYLSALIVLGIAFGIGVSTTFVTTHHILSRDPIPEKSASLHYVEMDNWDPDRGWSDEDPKAAPNQVTYRDAMELMKSTIPTHHSAMYKSYLYVFPDPKAGRPYRARVRLCFADFFPMFEVPFRYGTGWDRGADKTPEPVVVISNETNQKLFGGANSIGKPVRIDSREFKVVGVLDPWRPTPKFYDPHNGAMEEPDEVFIPFNFVIPMQIRTGGNTSSWKDSGRTPEEFLRSEAIWIQMWAQLDSPRQKEDYRQFLDNYVRSQQALGRMKRPLNNKLLPVMEWLDEVGAVPDESISFVIISLLFLLVCSLNLIGILLGKFLARAPEIGVRRALGASRMAIFMQHIIECEVIAVMGGVAGILLSILGLELVTRLFDGLFHLSLDWSMVALAIGMALLSGLIAGAYPAWRICSMAPAMYLKEQ